MDGSVQDVQLKAEGRGTEECRKDKLVILRRASVKNDKTFSFTISGL